MNLKSIFNLLEKSKILDISAYIFCALFALAGSLVSLYRFWQYEVFFYDFGIFDQAIWKVSRFKPPIIDHYVVGGKWIFADHFSPSIFLLSPLYWLTDKSEILLIAQALVVALSGLVLYLIGKNLTKNKLYSFSILVSYFLFVGLQNAVITDIHEVTFLVLPFLVCFWALMKNRIWLYFIFLIIMLGFKESTFTLGIGMGVAIFFLFKSLRKVALTTIALSILWAILAIKIVIPYFSGGQYYYNPSISSDFIYNATFLFNEPIKSRTVYYTFSSFGFLPLLSPAFWILILQDLVQRFLPQNTITRWDLGLHYSAQLAAILALSSLYTFGFLKKIKIVAKNVWVVSLLLIFNALFLFRFVLHGPFGLAYNPAFYSHTKNFDFLNELIQKIPKDSKVMAQNNLAVRFTHQELTLLRTNYFNYKPDYIIIDDRANQNPNNYFGIGKMSSILTPLSNDQNYTLYYKSNEQFIFKRRM